MPPSLTRLLTDELAHRRQNHQLRQLRIAVAGDAGELVLDDTRLVNFASNDYLGLTHHPRLIAAAVQAAQDFGVGAGASPLITGYTTLHALAQEKLANWKGTEQALLLPSGYQAAHAAIGTLSRIASFHRPGVRFLVDKLAHASLLDAIAAGGAAMRVFPHNHLGKLDRLLAAADPEQLQVVVTESVFSMDGDTADLAGLCQLKLRHHFTLLLDEAHASGVYGPAGAGYAAHCGLADQVDVSIVTLSKALGIAGGAVCATECFCQSVINWGRALIYSTAVSPIIPAAAIAAIDVMRDEPQRQERLGQLSRRVRTELAAAGLRIPQGDSPIIPVIMGTEQAALSASQSLRELGLFVPAIRPPTVPPGSSRLRISLSCQHNDQQIEQLVRAVCKLNPAPS